MKRKANIFLSGLCVAILIGIFVGFIYSVANFSTTDEKKQNIVITDSITVLQTDSVKIEL